jgi:hypothetical protein
LVFFWPGGYNYFHCDLIQCDGENKISTDDRYGLMIDVSPWRCSLPMTPTASFSPTTPLLIFMAPPLWGPLVDLYQGDLTI